MKKEGMAIFLIAKPLAKLLSPRVQVGELLIREPSSVDRQLLTLLIPSRRTQESPFQRPGNQRRQRAVSRNPALSIRLPGNLQITSRQNNPRKTASGVIAAPSSMASLVSPVFQEKNRRESRLRNGRPVAGPRGRQRLRFSLCSSFFWFRVSPLITAQPFT